MSYQDWELYNNTLTRKSNTTNNTTIKSRNVSNGGAKNSSTSNIRKASQPARNSTSQTTRKSTRKLVKRKQKYKKFAKNSLIMMMIAISLAGALRWANNENSNSKTAEDESSPSISQGVVSNPKDNADIPVIDMTNKEAELMDYKSHCYVDTYAGKQYLFCPEDYVLELAEYAIYKMNALYKDSGKMSVLDNGKCIPECITPELLAGICFTESSYRVESVEGLPLGADRDCSADKRAEGFLQQKPAFVQDADKFSKRYGGTGYTNQDRYNPLKAMEIAVNNFVRIYNSYLTADCDTYKNLGAKGANDPRILGALIIAYNQGEGSMQKWTEQGILDDVIDSPNSTNDYGAVYYRTVMKNIANVKDNEYVVD